MANNSFVTLSPAASFFTRSATSIALSKFEKSKATKIFFQFFILSSLILFFSSIDILKDTDFF